MGSEKQRKMKLPRKLQVLKTLTKSKSVRIPFSCAQHKFGKNYHYSSSSSSSSSYLSSFKVKKSSIIMDAFIYIYKLRMQVEAMKKEYHSLINHIQEVKVEKLVEVEGYFMVRVTCKKEEQLLVRIVEVFEELEVTVMQARVASEHFFRMEAIVQASNIDAEFLNQAILKVVQV